MNREAGLALVSALFLSVCVGLYASALFGIAYLDASAVANQTSGEVAFYAAEAGIEHTWATIPPAPTFAAELAWAGQTPPFGAVVDFGMPPTSYRVTVDAVSLERMSLRSVGTAVRGARRRIEASLCREKPFAPPAPLVLASVTVGTVAGAVELDGADRDAVLPIRAPLAVENDADRGGAARLTAAPAILLPLGSGLVAAAAALRPIVDRAVTGPFHDATFGGTAPEVVQWVGDAEVSGNSTAAGVIVADAPLRVRGRLAASGVLLATAGLEVDGELEVAGLLHVAGNVDLHPGSRLRVVAASTALDAADQLRPGTLPRAAILCGWREVW